MEHIVHIIEEVLLDTVKLVPFLFITYLFMEYLEHHASKKTTKMISNSGKLGPLWGSILGAFPQCGFSVASSNLYAFRMISLGTLISVYLSTSDEMLAVMISNQAEFSLILKILLVKVILGMIFGFLIDLIFRKKTLKKEEKNHLCEEEHCHCEENIWLSSLKHTLYTAFFVLLISFILELVIHSIGEENLGNLLTNNKWFGPFVSSFIGLIPNCASSVVITELYLNKALSFGSMISGLLTGAGAGLIVLFKNNKNIKENFGIILLLYFIGVISGLILNLIY